MSARGSSWVVAATMAVIAVSAGVFLLNPEVRLGAQNDWRSFSSGLRPAGSENVLGGTGSVELRLAGLGAADTVALVLSARPGRDAPTVEVSRGQGARMRTVLSDRPSRIALASGEGPLIAIEVSGEGGSDRAFYHLHEIVVVRGGGWVRARPWFPALMGLVAFAFWRRRSGRALVALWSLAAVVLSLAILTDPLSGHANPGLSAGARVLAALLVAASVLAEPRLRPLPRAIVLAGLGLFLGVIAHAASLNGPGYWQWAWQRLDGSRVFTAVIIASLPFFAARALHRLRKARLGFVLALLAAGVALSAAAALVVQPRGLDRMHAVIEHPGITSYFADARDLAPQPAWMASYPERLGGLRLHSKTKPPGPVLFYVGLIQVFGPGSLSAVVGALLIALGAGLAVPAVYLLARQVGEPPEAAFEAACVMAVAPSLLLFFPEFDQAFPMVTCVVLLLWHRAVRDRSLPAAVGLGLCAFLASSFSYSFLVLGVAGLAVALIDPGQASRAAALAGVVMLGSYSFLYAATGFDPIATFRAALHNQAGLAAELDRSYWAAVVNDPLDFALGAGWLASLLGLVTAVRGWGTRAGSVAVVGLFQIAMVDLSGLLPVEAARVWLLLTPFVAIPAGRELARWTQVERTVSLVMMVLLLAALAQNMRFIDRP